MKEKIKYKMRIKTLALLILVSLALAFLIFFFKSTYLANELIEIENDIYATEIQDLVLDSALDGLDYVPFKR
jgi:hypothetical protein